MKTKVNFLIVIIILIISSSTMAQIDSISVDDFLYQYTTGNKVYGYFDTHTDSVNIGTSGESSWDFSGLTYDDSHTFNVINPTNTPYRPDYPFSQFSWEYTNDSGHFWEFYCHHINIHLHGKVFTYDSLPGYVKKLIYNPIFVHAPLPMIFNNTKRDSLVETTVELQDTDTVAVSFKTIVTNRLVDAYGPITFPDGRTEEALRVKSTQNIYSDSTGTTLADRNVIYQWYTQDGELLMFETDASSSDTGMVAVKENSIKWIFNNEIVADVKDDLSLQPLDFSLNQNYPNPFNPTTTITYSIPQNAHVQVKVFNAIGKEVAVLANETMPAGVHSLTFDGQGLSSGIYFVKMNAGVFNKVIKMAMVK